MCPEATFDFSVLPVPHTWAQPARRSYAGEKGWLWEDLGAPWMTGKPRLVLSRILSACIWEGTYQQLLRTIASSKWSKSQESSTAIPLQQQPLGGEVPLQTSNSWRCRTENYHKCGVGPTRPLGCTSHRARGPYAAFCGPSTLLPALFHSDCPSWVEWMFQ